MHFAGLALFVNESNQCIKIESVMSKKSREIGLLDLGVKGTDLKG
jgi:hypothetical protein